MGPIASQITSLTIVYSIVYSDADQRKHQSFSLLAFVRGIHQGPVDSPHKWPVTRKMFLFDDVMIHVLLEHRFIPSEHRFRMHVMHYFTVKDDLVKLPRAASLHQNEC